MWSHNLLEELVLSPESPNDFWRFHVFFSFFLFFLKVVLWTKRLLFHKSEATFQNQFSLNNFFALHSSMFRNMCKLHHKVRNGQNIPAWSSSFSNYIFLSNLTNNLGHFSTNLRPHFQNSFFFINFEKKKCVNRVTICIMPKVGWQSDLHGKTNLNIACVSCSCWLHVTKRADHHPHHSHTSPKQWCLVTWCQTLHIIIRLNDKLCI